MQEPPCRQALSKHPRLPLRPGKRKLELEPICATDGQPPGGGNTQWGKSQAFQPVLEKTWG